jgi:multidrug efflux pump subunit AcrA (membrane-fusion protein)
MKEKLKTFIEDVKLLKTRALVISAVSVSVITIGALAFLVSKSDSMDRANAESSNKDSASNSVAVAVVGEEDSSIIGNTASNNSWPGEIISLNNLQVQPGREGTISEWYVRIGQRVSAGQVIGRLSRPPQTPEMVGMLSEKLEDLSGARTSTAALRAYTTKRISQLQQLRVDTENSNRQKMDLLGSNTSVSGDILLSSIASKKKMAQVVLRGSITKLVPMLYNQTSIPSLEVIQNINIKPSFGLLDSSLRNSFPSILYKALSDLKDVHAIPEQSGTTYFDSAIKLANASVGGGEELTAVDLSAIKEMLIEDQLEFVTALSEIKTMELERANTQRESIDTLAEIDAMIAELEKELAMAEGEVTAKEGAYGSIRGSITSGYSVVAPNSGVVSSIMKKPGEFVGPGMPVATVTAGNASSVLVRMSLPSNIQKPAIGEILSVTRPGFGSDIQKVRLVGIGSSLDSGSYMADAVFLEPTKWPVGISVRVLAPVSSSSVFIKYSSLFWSEEGSPTVWAVSEADRIFAQKVVIGRTMGALVEVYTGLKNGDRYVLNPTPDIKENMFLGDVAGSSPSKEHDASEADEHENMPGM